MKSRSVTTVLDVPMERAFDYLARLENLPLWANEFARELRFEGRHAKVVNGLGEFYVDIHSDAASGVIDFYAGPEPDQLAVFPSRVVALDAARSAYTFTMFQAPGMPDELFDAQHASLVRELANIERQVA